MGWDIALPTKKLLAHSRQLIHAYMQSLAWKLTLAFLLVGVLGVILFAVLVGQRTRSEFDRFLSAHDQSVLLSALNDYYATHGSWNGINHMLASTPPLDFYSRSIALTDINGIVVLGNVSYAAGQAIPRGELNAGTSITVNGQTVGFVLFARPNAEAERSTPGLEADFWRRVIWAAITSAIITVLIALILGGILARTLTHPVSELTAATKAMAGGKLDQRVNVHSRDEIGELATSFNQMSADLARASQLRKQMTADLAHDLRTPLTILRGYMEGLKEGRLQGSSTLYDVMYGEVEHLQRLVEDLRVLSLADAGELPLNRRTVDPMALLERTGLAYFVQAEQQGLALRVEPTGETTAALPSISVDTDRMTQVLNNLVSNALRYTAQGEIVLSASSENQHISLSVSDTGIGIEPEHLPFVFDRFYRADQSRQRPNHNSDADSASSGLGLAIAKAIVEAHGGSLVVESTLGHGTTFTITLPVSPASVENDGSDKDNRKRVVVGASQP
jgi:two-component system sensor histidine kinase BaeS